MFTLSTDDRLSAWAQLRRTIETSLTPYIDVWEFWKHAPFTPHNHHIDQHNFTTWPTPWEIIVDNIYDEFTKALMIAKSFKLTSKWRDSNIEIQTFTNANKTRAYFVVSIDNQIAINFTDSGPVLYTEITNDLFLESAVPVQI